jgi:hypothetical protein
MKRNAKDAPYHYCKPTWPAEMSDPTDLTQMPTQYSIAKVTVQGIDKSLRRRMELANPLLECPVPQYTMERKLLFIVPEPALFTNANLVRQMVYYTSWLKVRHVWFPRLATEQLQGLDGQAWRDVLYGKYKRSNSPPKPALVAPAPIASVSALPALYASSSAAVIQAGPSVIPPLDFLDDDLDDDELTGLAKGFLCPLPADVQPLRSEGECQTAEPRNWRSIAHEVWFQLVERPTTIKQVGSSGKRKRLVESEWDVWIDYELNRMIYFCEYVDPVSRDRADGERYVQPFVFESIAGTLVPSSRRIWKALDRHISDSYPKLWPNASLPFVQMSTASDASDEDPAIASQALDLKSPDLLPGDVVFGNEYFDKEGQLIFEGTLLKDVDLEDKRWQQYLLWEMAEVNFRCSRTHDSLPR